MKTLHVTGREKLFLLKPQAVPVPTSNQRSVHVETGLASVSPLDSGHRSFRLDAPS